MRAKRERRRGPGPTALLICVGGTVLGFLAGHALGAKLTDQTLRAVIDGVGEQLRLAQNDPTLQAMTIAAATAIAAATLVPIVTVLVLHQRLKHDEEEDDEKAIRAEGPFGTLPGAGRRWRADRHGALPAGHAAGDSCADRSADDRLLIRVAGECDA